MENCQTIKEFFNNKKEITKKDNIELAKINILKKRRREPKKSKEPREKNKRKLKNKILKSKYILVIKTKKQAFNYDFRRS